MKINKYPDGSSYVEVEDDLRVLQRSKEGYKFTYRINSYEDLWHLGQTLEILNWKGCSPIVTIPNLIDAQADRRFATNQSFGLKMVCNFLNQFDAHYQIFHPHNPEVLEALLNSVSIISNSDFIKEVLANLEIFGDKDDSNTILMSADSGGFKPLIKLCDDINWTGETYSASKARNLSTAELTQLVDREDFGGKDIIIVDDICVYGGTFKGLSTLLRDRNIGKLYLAVSHMTVQNLGLSPVTRHFDKVFTTNSKYDKYYMSNDLYRAAQPKNLEIIKLF